jgi:hypothetical protein
MFARRLLLTAMLFPVFTLSAQQQGVAAPSAAEDVSLPPGRFNLYLTQVGGAWTAYAESGGRVYPAKRSIETPDGPPGQQPRFSRGSGCWWLWLITGIQVCW